MTTKTISAAVPAQVKKEAVAVLAAHGIGMSAFLRKMMALIAARDAEALAWIEEARNVRNGDTASGSHRWK